MKINSVWVGNDSTADKTLKYKTTTTPAPEKQVEIVPSYDKQMVPNFQQGWVCPKCGRVNAPWVSTCTCQDSFEVIINFKNYIPAPCRGCPNHPSNGGSGICHCILGGSQITC